MVTIAEKSGSSPRGVGSKMFVEPSGHITGSIGGGKVEYEAINLCKEVKEKEVNLWYLDNFKFGELSVGADRD